MRTSVHTERSSLLGDGWILSFRLCAKCSFWGLQARLHLWGGLYSVFQTLRQVWILGDYGRSSLVGEGCIPSVRLRAKSSFWVFRPSLHFWGMAPFCDSSFAQGLHLGPCGHVFIFGGRLYSVLQILRQVLMLGPSAKSAFLGLAVISPSSFAPNLDFGPVGQVFTFGGWLHSVIQVSHKVCIWGLAGTSSLLRVGCIPSFIFCAKSAFWALWTHYHFLGLAVFCPPDFAAGLHVGPFGKSSLLGSICILSFRLCLKS